MLEVSPAAISQYENGPQTPRPEVMDKICEKIGFPHNFYMRPAHPEDDDPIFWRSNAAATQTARERSLQRLRWLKEIRSFLLNYFDFPKLSLPSFWVPDDFRVLTDEHIEKYAQDCRDWWGFGYEPIPDLVLELENSGVITARINVAADTLDAFSQWASSDGTPYIVLGKDKASAARSRFDAAHELGHILIHRRVDRRRVNSKSDWKILEHQANRFAAAFLLPAGSFAGELWAATLDSFAAQKQRWKVSIGMMIVRCSHLGIVNSDQSKRLWINYNRRGWRSEEPLDKVIKLEEPRVLRRSIEMMLTEGVRGKAQIVESLALPPREIEQLVALPLGFFSSNEAEIKAFPKLKVQPTEGADGTAKVIPLFDRKEG
jgi:Zn-dependent peptidase ImmA (M78 family)/transcriptional regulator with XRE-family HTH domain